MQRTQKLYYLEYKEYLDFIEECSNKKYKEELVLHKHHVIPTFIHTDKEFRNKTVLLSVEDHIEAHYKLSKCFDKGSYERIGNLRAVKLLSKNSIKYKEALKEVYKNQTGENNPSKLPENKLKISQGLIKYYLNNTNSKAGKSYEQIYGDQAETEKLKRKKCTRTPEEYRKSAQKAALKNRGRIPHNAQKVKYNGNVYTSLTQASNKTGVSVYLIKKQIKNEEENN